MTYLDEFSTRACWRVLNQVTTSESNRYSITSREKKFMAMSAVVRDRNSNEEYWKYEITEIVGNGNSSIHERFIRAGDRITKADKTGFR